MNFSQSTGDQGLPTLNKLRKKERGFASLLHVTQTQREDMAAGSLV